jgi:hypothetical protein
MMDCLQAESFQEGRGFSEAAKTVAGIKGIAAKTRYFQDREREFLKMAIGIIIPCEPRLPGSLIIIGREPR